MKSILTIISLTVLVIISGCVSQNTDDINGNENSVVLCETDYIVGGSMISNPDNYDTTCERMCSDKYKIETHRIDKKTDSFAMCYCDINEC